MVLTTNLKNVFYFTKSYGNFSKMDIYFCPFFNFFVENYKQNMQNFDLKHNAVKSK